MRKELTTVEYLGDTIHLFGDRYTCDDSKAIIAEYGDGEPFATVTINLSDYNVALENDEIVINHDLLYCGEFLEKVIEVLGFPGVTMKPISYGYANSHIMKLRPEFLKYWEQWNERSL